MNAIQQIKNILNAATSDTVTLRADVHFGPPERCMMTGHHYHGDDWQRYDYADSFEFSLSQLTTAIDAAGWVMPSRPVKQRGFAFHYILERDAERMQSGYTAHHVSGETIDRKNQQMRFREIEMVQEMFA